jgi:hypothetical protein
MLIISILLYIDERLRGVKMLAFALTVRSIMLY